MLTTLDLTLYVMKTSHSSLMSSSHALLPDTLYITVWSLWAFSLELLPRNSKILLLDQHFPNFSIHLNYPESNYPEFIGSNPRVSVGLG